MIELISTIADLLISISLLMYIVSSQKEIRMLRMQNDLLLKSYNLARKVYEDRINNLKNEEEVSEYEA